MEASSHEHVKPKIIAFHLPQFHQIPENDQWWGTGFTEWTNTKKATPLYPGHSQPKEPLGDYYYDLADPRARAWQAATAKKYGVYGFCYYHYWFKGKRLLEMPVNEILSTGEPNFPFCLSWANENWSSRWDGGNHDLLMVQEYGDEEDWEDHFAYLLKAFSDPRYIRVGTKPLFVIYRPVNIPRCEEMLKYWDRLAIKNGLDGLYFAEQLNTDYTSNIHRIDANIEFEPLYTLKHDLDPQNMDDVYNRINNSSGTFRSARYDYFWNRIIQRTPSVYTRKTFLGGFVDWDNTARMGRSSLHFCEGSPEKFGHYMSQQIGKARTMGSEFVFINAWNEWAEGAYLEPDKKYGYRYLEELQKALIQNGAL